MSEEDIVERLQKTIEQLKQENEYLRSQLAAATHLEPSTQSTEPLPEYSKTVVVKFKDGHKETHVYSNTVEQDYLTIIKEVVNMFPKGSVKNVLIVEK